ncbi:hypothetical protein RN001_009925 [Aquatica leii]|uniref:Palmitoyltransferase n=1 Tax=Aquatica leii TaxID=1421715 RepID=A0AAN7P5N9_9COLE|nr:hypothetical protein RN001_009925 [Aquatica leii]
MILRTKILPRNISDAAVTIFTLLIIPVVYWFELFVVMPTFHDLWSFWYNFHFIMGTIIFINVSANYAAIVLCDTSIKGRLMPMTKQPQWHYCATCESLAPPRSWHCNICNICILKRDHHCMFTSCCIGHHNHRYFLMFVMYLFIASLYATIYNSFFIWARVDFSNFMSLFKVIFPLAMLLVDHSFNQTYLFLYLIVLITFVFTGALLYFHIGLLLKGTVTYERNRNCKEYDLGTVMNIKTVLGEHWYLVWISPFITSELSSDGIKWNKAASMKAK